MHYNIQIAIQQVLDGPTRLPGRGATPEEGKREIVETARIAVTAPSEAEAFAKAYRLLAASQPEAEVHVHRASCDDARGNHVCGK